MEHWTWASARRRGTSHIKTNTPCQDAALTFAAHPGRLASIVSDGAGSAAMGGAGAYITTRSLARAIVESGADPLPDETTLWTWLDAVRDRIGVAARKRGLAPRDFAATMLLTLADASGAVLALVGDGAAAVRQNGVWSVPSWPQHGEYASTTYFITDEPEAQMRIIRLEQCPEVIVLMSDGLERLALDFAAKAPHAPFFEMVAKPVGSSTVSGRDGPLSNALAKYLDGAAVNARTDDDKTLVVAVRR